MGVTATGKTDLAIRLAERLPIDIISVDSTMVYRGLDIGTGKPDPRLLKRIPHGLVDIRDPNETYSVHEFLCDAWKLITKSNTLGRLPLLVGGTMLYFRVLRDGLAELPAGDARIRAQIEARAKAQGWEELHEELKRQDPRAAAGMAPENAARITRALEVAAITGKTISAWWQAGNRGGWREKACAQVKEIALDHPDKKMHWLLLEERLNAMFERGLVAEVETLRARHRDLSLSSVSMRAVGYRQIWQGLDQGRSEQETFDAAFAATRRLAKRQRTWLRRFPGVTRIRSDDANIERVLEDQMAQLLDRAQSS